MPLYEIADGRQLLHIQHKKFPEVDLKERQHLQALFRDNPQAISPDLLVIAEEFSDWTDSSRRIDLLALDREANLVVVELKRVQEDHMELQAIRYAAMVAPMDFDAVVVTYEAYLSKQGKHVADARTELLRFLGTTDDVEISSSPKIILISPSFSKEVTTTVLWLNDRGLKIRCMQARPYKLDEKLYIDIEQIIPLPSADSYLVSLGKKALKAERQASTTRSTSTTSILQAAGLLKIDTRLVLFRLPRRGMTITDERARFATFLGGNIIRWDFDQQTYSLTRVCDLICEKFGGDDGLGFSGNGTDYWAIEDDTFSLYERSKLPSSGAELQGVLTAKVDS